MAETTTINGVTWQRLSADSLFHFDSFVDVSTSNGRLLATAKHGNCPSYCVSEDVYLISSADGLTWTILGQLPPNPDVVSVHETSFGFFVAGTTDGYGSGDHAGLWRSTDGAAWTLLSDQRVFQPGECATGDRDEVGDVYETPTGLVAQGSATWFSTDGQTWTCIAPQDKQVWPVNGHFFGLQRDYTKDTATLSVSDDGLTWRELGTVPAGANASVEPVADGFVAVRETDSRFPKNQYAYFSPDGKSWQRLPDPLGPGYTYAVTSDGVRAAAVEEASPGAIWLSSSDGRTWSRYEVPTHQQPGSAPDSVDGVATLGQTVVGYGIASGDAVSAVAWVAQIP